MPGSKKKGRTQKKPIINSVTSWWYASPLTLPPSLPYFPFPLCSLAPCLLVQKPSKSHPRLKRPFSIRNSNEFPGLWCSIRRLLGGKKGAIELYVDACRSIDFFLRRGGESVAYNVFTRLCPPIPLWSSASIPASTIIFIHRSSPWKSPVPQTLLKHPRHAYACENCFRPFDLSSNIETRLIVSRKGGLISSSPCKWMPMSKLGRWKVFFETKDFTCLKKGVERKRILKNLILGIYIENILLYLR